MATPPPVSSLTKEQAHAEFGKLTDRIAAKVEELNSGECGAVGTPVFTAKSQELALLYARMSQLCSKLGLPWPKELWRPPHFKH